MNIDFFTFGALVLKILVLVGFDVYAIFAVVMVRQEYLMAHVLEESFEPFLRMLVFVHLAAAVGLFFLALVIL